MTRERYQIPDDVRDALAEAGLSEAYEARPPYQRNDYIGWIGQAKTDRTRSRRMAQMLAELREGGVYMGMVHNPSKK